MADEHEEQQRHEIQRSKVIPLIEKATNSTDRDIDPRLLKAIKLIVRRSDIELKFASQTLFSLMKRPHSQIRYLALLIIDELFMRSKLFRGLICEDLDNLLSLSVGFRRSQPLPAPPAIATILRSKAIEFLEKWNFTYGFYYRQVRLGYEYLKNTLRYKFPNLQANAARVERERREREVKTQEILRSKFESLREGMGAIREEIMATIDEIGECLEVARVKEGNVGGVPLDDGEEEEFEVRNAELLRIRMNSLMEAGKVRENSENKVVFDVLRELYKFLVTKHLVSVQQWISVIIRVEVDDSRFRDSVLKEFIDFRNRILGVKKKCEDSGCAVLDTKEDEDDDIWEEGEIDFVDRSQEIEVAKIVDAVSTVDAAEPRSGAGRKRDNLKGKAVAGKGKGKVASVDLDSVKGKLLAEAPVVNWGSALDRWGEKRDVLAHQRGMELDSHWGRVDYDATIPAEKIAELNVHASVYKEEQAEIRPCRAPLRKGGLCQRRDLRVCPFHGPIVPRDDEGKPIHREDGEGTSGSAVHSDSMTMRRSPSAEEMDIDESNVSMEQLAEQALKNVRGRDRAEAKRKEIDQKALKKAKLAKVREHNDAVLREAAMTSSYSAYSGEFEGGTSGGSAAVKSKKPTLASMLRKKVTAKDRLAQKLLGTRARDATIKQLTQSEDTKYRESFPNQW